MKNISKKFLIGTLLLAIMGGAAWASTKKNLVGGPCTYTGYAGKCTFVVSKKGTNFTFTGKINGSEVKLKGNETEGKFQDGVIVDCSIKFITKGTCTPCGFDINGTWGSCGKEAWLKMDILTH